MKRQTNHNRRKRHQLKLGRHIGQYVGWHSADTSADMLQLTVGGVSVDCLWYQSIVHRCFAETAAISLPTGEQENTPRSVQSGQNAHKILKKNLTWQHRMVIFFKIPYISERLNHRITNIFRKETIPLRIAHTSYTLRKAPSHTSTERKSTRDKCPISNTELRLRRNEVYQLTCSRCNH